MNAFPFAVAATACLSACTPYGPAVTLVKEGPCAGAEAWQDELRSLPAGALLKVGASYMWDTCSGTAQVAATNLLLRRSEAPSAQRLNRLLACSSARILVSYPPDGILPDGLVEIDVRPDAGNYAVTLRADSVAKNVQLLRRAKALAEPRNMTGS